MSGIYGPSMRWYDRLRSGLSSGTTLGQDTGAIWSALTDWGAEGRSPFLQYILGPKASAPGPSRPAAPAAPAPTVPSVGGFVPPALPTSGAAGGGGGGAALMSALRQRLANYQQMQVASQQAVRDLFLNAEQALAAREAAIRARTPEQAAQAAAVYEEAAGAMQAAEQTIAAANANPEGEMGVYMAPGQSSDWVSLMQAQAPAEQNLTQRMGDISAEDAAWLASLAQSQSAGYQSEIQRLAMSMAMQDQAQTQQAAAAMAAGGGGGGRTVDPYEQYAADVGLATSLNNPGILVQKYRMTQEQAQQAVNDYLSQLERLAAIGG